MYRGEAGKTMILCFSRCTLLPSPQDVAKEGRGRWRRWWCAAFVVVTVIVTPRDRGSWRQLPYGTSISENLLTHHHGHYQPPGDAASLLAQRSLLLLVPTHIVHAVIARQCVHLNLRPQLPPQILELQICSRGCKLASGTLTSES